MHVQKKTQWITFFNQDRLPRRVLVGCCMVLRIGAIGLHSYYKSAYLHFSFTVYLSLKQSPGLRVLPGRSSVDISPGKTSRDQMKIGNVKKETDKDCGNSNEKAEATE